MPDPNERSKELFMQYATGTTKSNEIVMTKQDFCECFDLTEESVDAIGYFNLADADDTDFISFDEFVSFQNLMSTSSFEILGLAHVLDKDENDRISVQEWKAVLQDLVPPKELFGEKLDKEISFRQFETWMRKMEKRVIEHDWSIIARKSDNTASVRDFLNIISRHTRADLMLHRSPYIVENICSYFQGKDNRGRVSYSEFQVFMNIMNSRQSLASKLVGLDADHDGIVRENEFDAAINSETTSKEMKTQLEMMFDIFMDPKTKAVDTSDFLHFAGSIATRGGQEVNQMTLFESLGIGIISGAVGATVVYPIDKLKTRVQLIPRSDSRGLFRILSDIVKAEGPAYLFRGLSAQLAGVPFVKGCSLATNNFMRHNIFREGVGQKTKLAPWEEVVAGTATGIVTSIMYTPSERVKIMMQTQGMPNGLPKGTSLSETVSSIIQKNGVKELWRGFNATLLREIPFCTINYTTYNAAKRYFKENDGSITPFHAFVSGICGGATAAALDTPADTIKTRIQNSKPGTYKGIIDCATKTFQKDGLAPFYRGVLPRALMVGPKYGCILLVYERLQKWLFEGKRSAIHNIQHDLDAMDKSRLRSLEASALLKYGISVTV